MLDIQFIRDNRKIVAEKSQAKGYKKVDEQFIDLLLETYEKRNEILSKVEESHRQSNELNETIKGKKPTSDQIEEGRSLREERKILDAKLSEAEKKYVEMLKAVPNMPLDFVPIGSSEEENEVTRTVGGINESVDILGFKPLNDYEIGTERDLIDKERAAKVSGSRFAYLKGDIVRLQFAIIQFVMTTLGDEEVLQDLIDKNDIRDKYGNKLSSKPFTPVLPPAMLRTAPYVASARLNAEEVTYKIEQDDLWLNASAEHTLCTMYWNEILPEEMFPIRYIGYSTSFRREAGTYGKDVEGIFRMHQFDKLEMEVFSTEETGLAEHKLLVAVQEYLMQQLGLPYRVLQKCTFDIGKPNAAGVDIECWFPGQGQYRETHTADYMTDYQSRDLKIRVRRSMKPTNEFKAITTGITDGYSGGDIQLVHTNDATAFALGRILKAIIENYQTKDKQISIPEVLRPYMGGQAVI